MAFWEDDDALDAFLADHPFAQRLAGGWSVRLEPQRAVPVAGGHWPALAADPPGRDTIHHDGPVAVLTIARTRPRRAVAFRRASARAEAQIDDAPGLLWATGLANLAQRVVATFSLWESAAAARAYATTTTGHTEAMRREAQRSFHHVGSFIRYRPYAAQGHLPVRRNPLPETITANLNS